VEVQKKAAGQTKVTEGQLPYLAHYYTLIKWNIIVDNTPVRINIHHDQMKVAAWNLPKSK
jgi:hypothetical protein